MQYDGNWRRTRKKMKLIGRTASFKKNSTIFLRNLTVFNTTRAPICDKMECVVELPNTATNELVHEKERYKAISEELDSTFQELSGY
ncbi:hypothetical protein ANCCEY_08753 [Ancylostoma ceylanicum]|uniref:Uncharacterized protein n=1 Tax=Ancylostoma ceylanicum TaxID=53326 RepID=A0A0D6LWZ4_9BILA|nr:hypothetical protein ANCCEY_08753 [Ancylostoma ceylanicum]